MLILEHGDDGGVDRVSRVLIRLEALEDVQHRPEHIEERRMPRKVIKELFTRKGRVGA